MFGEKGIREINPSAPISGLLEKGCEFEGKLTFEGTVRINGKFSGEIFSDGVLVVGEGAAIEGKVDVGSIIIHGEVKGTIKARDRIEMHTPAVVDGDIISQTLVIDEGVIFEGSCSMGKKGQIRSIDSAKVAASQI